MLVHVLWDKSIYSVKGLLAIPARRGTPTEGGTQRRLCAAFEGEFRRRLNAWPHSAEEAAAANMLLEIPKCGKQRSS